jgi:hypothetical protein
LAQQKKPRKVGRPKLPKGEAKGRIVPVRFTADDSRLVNRYARAKHKTISEWMRIALPLEANVKYKGYLIQLATRTDREAGGFTTTGWITNENNGRPTSFVAPGGQPTKAAALEFGIAWCKERIDLGNTNDARLQP